MNKRFTAMAVASLVAFLACQDSTVPELGEEGIGEIGRPNIAITNPGDSYGFVDSLFTFLKPLVADPLVAGQTLNQNLQPIIELWVRDSVDLSDNPHACVGKLKPGGGFYAPIDTFTPEVDFDATRYEYGWKTGVEPAGGLTEGTDYRLCVKVLIVGEGGTAEYQLVGWRDVRPDKTTDPNSPPGTPYLFQNGSNVPIKFWISSKALCLDENNQVIDCTIATFGTGGGTATCDAAQCGIDVPEDVIQGGELATFVVRYVQCDAYNETPVGTVEYLDIDIPQYFGCLTVTSAATYDWASTGYDVPGDGITIGSCRDTDILGPQDERLLLHIESKLDADGDLRPDVYALPTRPFDLQCGDPPLSPPAASASVGEWAMYYVKRGAQTLLPWMNPPELEAAHSGFGGGTSLGCGGGSAGADDASRVRGCSAAALAPSSESVAMQAGEAVTFRAVWALPSKITEKLEWLAAGDPPVTEPWVDPVSGTAGGPPLYPAVKVTDECEPDSDGVVTETCADPSDVPAPVEGATVTFTFFKMDGTTLGTPVQVVTDAYGIAQAPWTLPSAGLWEATAGGLGIGVDGSLINDNAAVPGDTGTGAFQDHIGNEAVVLETGAVRFQASACSDKSAVLTSLTVDSLIYDNSAQIPINVSGSDADFATLWWTSDCYNVYFALEVPAAEDLQNSLRFVFVDSLEAGWALGFDSTKTGEMTWFSEVPILGDDMWFISRNTNKKDAIPDGSWVIEDWHVSDDCTGSSKQSECGKADTDAVPAGTYDLLSAVAGPVYAVGTTTVYEFARSFVSADPLDFYVPSIGQSTWIGFYLVLQQGKGAQGNSEFPDFRVFQPIQIIRQ